MAYRPLTDIPISLLTASSTMASGYVLKAYLTNTTTPTTLYSDASGTSAGTSITLDARGEPTTIKRVWLNTSVTYKLVLETDGGSVVWTADPIYGSSVVGGDGSQLTVAATGASLGRPLADHFADVINVNNYADLVVDGDWEPAITAAIADCPEYGVVQLAGSMTIGATITVATDNITIQGPAKLTAKAATNFEFMLYGTGRTNVVFQNLELDANKANRSGSQNVRFMGGCFVSSTNCGYINVTVSGGRGYGGISAVGLALSASTRCFVDNCTLSNSGDSGYDSDGVFTSGTQNTIANCRAYNCTDTAFVIENSDYSVISGCSSYNCSAGAAVTLAGNDNRTGNAIIGLTVRNWDAASTGGVQIGCLSGSGNLYDTVVDGVVMYADTGSGYGSGAAVWVRKGATGEAQGVDISGLTVNGATYGVRVDDGDNVTVSGTIKNVTSTSVYFVNGVDHAVKNSHLQGGDYGVLTANAAECDAFCNSFRGQTISSISALNTSTINNFMNTFRGLSGVRVSKDAGATINSMTQLGSQPVLTANVLTNGVAGTLAKKVEVYDHNAASQGFLYLYTT